MKIINLTQHNATEDQVAAGVIDLQGDMKAALVAAITFPPIYTKADLVMAARVVNELIRDHVGMHGQIDGVMIGGMPSFMPVLETLLMSKGIKVGYACSERVSKDIPQADGTVKKVAVFAHVGMYWA